MELDWNKGLVPAIVQHAETGEVLMLGFMSADSLAETERTGRVTFFSRSRQKIWVKGETSGRFLDVVEMHADCDRDTVLIRARPHGPVCHRGTPTCFDAEKPAHAFLASLESTIAARFAAGDSASSYVARLIREGFDRIAQKVGEEAIETVIASKNPELEPFEGEAADLLFHLMVLLRARGSSLSRITDVLERRHAARVDPPRVGEKLAAQTADRVDLDPPAGGSPRVTSTAK